MEFKQIQELIKLINKSNVAEFKMKQEDLELVIRTKEYQKGGVPAQVSAPSVVSIPAAQAMAPVHHTPATHAPAAATEAPTTTDETPAQEESATNLVEIKSPIVGTFYRSSSPDKPPFIKVGDTISAGDTVCIVEAMKLFNEIESEVSGKIVKAMTEDASPVQYDQVLFLVDPAG